MTPEQIIEAAHARFTDGKGRAVDKNAGCVYRTADGNKCMVGAVLPDHVYTATMEGKGIGTLLETHIVPSWMHQHRNLLAVLQDLHDRPDYWNVDPVTGRPGLNKLGCTLFNQLVNGVFGLGGAYKYHLNSNL